MIEQQQLSPGAVLREDTEIDAVVAQCRTEGKAGPGLRDDGRRRRWRCGYGIGHGLAFQISAAYSAMVRSLENLPELAMFKMTLCVQSS